MPARPIHKWKSFWFGILVLGFLGWAWVKTMDHVAMVYRIEGQWIRGVASGSGTVSYVTARYGVEGEEWGFSFDENWGEEEWPFFADAFKQVREDGGGQTAVAHWVLLLGFLMGWVGLLGWRWRKLRMKVRPELGGEVAPTR
jgi:hypothetical protein